MNLITVKCANDTAVQALSDRARYLGGRLTERAGLLCMFAVPPARAYKFRTTAATLGTIMADPEPAATQAPGRDMQWDHYLKHHQPYNELEDY